MKRAEFKNYLKSYCAEFSLVLPDYDVRAKLFDEFSKTKYSDQMDLECEVWDFFDKNVLMKEKPKEMLTMNSICAFDLQCKVAPCEASNKPACKKEVENTMNYNEIEASRKYLNGRLCEARYTVEESLVKQFNLRNPVQPSNYKQLIAAITGNQYTLDTKRTAVVDAAVAEGEVYAFGAFDGIKWMLPNAPDREGFELALKAVEKARTAAKDVINTGTPADGLKALQDFEAFTYTPPAASSTSAS